MVSRIVKLNNNMLTGVSRGLKRVETSLTGDTADEIDMLTNSYNDMLCKIEENTKLQAENAKAIKNAELRVLQEQINPHFLYNVLDLIGWTALKNENKKVAYLVRSLARFYKIGLHKGKEMITVAKELEYIRLYMNIQQVRFENLRDLETDIPEELMECTIQKSLFLPIVENAVNHGIRDTNTDGRITISAEYDDRDIIFCVRDNGSGIPPETVAQLTDGTYEGGVEGGFGIKNLNERIKLFYGEEYGVSFGDCRDGAEVYIKIARVRYE